MQAHGVVRAPMTARAIEGAAIELVLAHGYADVTVDMICDAARVSQRTFFNYFKTKDAALLGNALPEIDVERARVFADSTGPLLAEAIGLIRVDTEFVFDDEKLFADRIRAISSHPELLARQMERLAGIETGAAPAHRGEARAPASGARCGRPGPADRLHHQHRGRSHEVPRPGDRPLDRERRTAPRPGPARQAHRRRAAAAGMTAGSPRIRPSAHPLIASASFTRPPILSSELE